jgi:hypothetical protein
MEGMAKYTGRLNFMGRILLPPIYNLCVFPRVSSLFLSSVCPEVELAPTEPNVGHQEKSN